MPTLSATFEPITNRETWVEAVQFFDNETGETIDLSAVTAAKIEVSLPGTTRPSLSGTLADGTIVILSDGVLRWTFSAEKMGALTNRTYDIGALLSQEGQTIQFILGTIPVLEGQVSAL